MEMLEAVLTHLRNWFPVRCDAGTFTIASGIPDVDFLRPGQYYRIRGSVFSDGLHVYQSGETLADETSRAKSGRWQSRKASESLRLKSQRTRKRTR